MPGARSMRALEHGDSEDDAGEQRRHGQVSNEVIDAAVTGHVLQAGMITGGVHYNAVPQQFAVPRQLPMAPAGFVGRTDELSRLTASLGKAAGEGNKVMILAL